MGQRDLLESVLWAAECTLATLSYEADRSRPSARSLKRHGDIAAQLIWDAIQTARPEHIRKHLSPYSRVRAIVERWLDGIHPTPEGLEAVVGLYIAARRRGEVW